MIFNKTALLLFITLNLVHSEGTSGRCYFDINPRYKTQTDFQYNSTNRYITQTKYILSLPTENKYIPIVFDLSLPSFTFHSDKVSPSISNFPPMPIHFPSATGK